MESLGCEPGEEPSATRGLSAVGDSVDHGRREQLLLNRRLTSRAKLDLKDRLEAANLGSLLFEYGPPPALGRVSARPGSSRPATVRSSVTRARQKAERSTCDSQVVDGNLSRPETARLSTRQDDRLPWGWGGGVRGDGDVCSKVAAGLPRGRGRSPRLVPAKKAGADLHPVEMQGVIVRLFGGARALCLVRCHADMHREGKGGAVTSVAGVQEHRGHRQPQKNAGKASLASPHRQSADSQRNRRKGEVGKLEACNAPGPAFQHCKLVSGGLTGETDLSHKHASGRVLLIRTAALFSVARAPRADGKGRVGGGREGAGAGGLAGKAISRPYRDENKEGMRGRPEGGFFLSRALRAEASKRGKVQTCAPTTPALAQETLARKRKKMQGQEAGRRELLTQVHLSPHSASSQAEASEQSERSTPDNVLVIPHFRFVFMCVEVSRIV